VAAAGTSFFSKHIKIEGFALPLLHNTTEQALSCSYALALVNEPSTPYSSTYFLSLSISLSPSTSASLHNSLLLLVLMFLPAPPIN